MVHYDETFHTSELFSAWGADCPAIVAAEEDHRCLHNSCKVERSMEVSLNILVCQESWIKCYWRATV